MKKVLWVNPSFLDYRIPLYGELSKLLKDNFSLLYSKDRIPNRCHMKIKNVLGERALFIEHEKTFHVGKKSDFANQGHTIPLPLGIYGKIKKSAPDVIISEGFFQYTPLSLLYKLIHKKKLIISYERTIHTERNCHLFVKWYRKIVCRFVDAFIVNGSLTEKYLNTLGVKNDKIFKGAMCADSKWLKEKISSLSKDEIQKNKRIYTKADEGLVFIFVGRLIKLKGVDRLIISWNEHIKNYKHDYLLIIGDGPERVYLENLGKGNNVIFMGGVDYDSIYKYYAISDVFIIPTLEDNWSLVVPEAMACGLPIACSIYNGCYPELVKQDVNGALFDPMNQRSIISVLEYFHCKDLVEMGNNSRIIEEDYSPRKTALRIKKAIENC